MNVLIDVNIWIDVALRPDSYPDSKSALIAMQRKNYTLGFPLSGYTTVYYLLKQYLKKNKAMEFLRLLKQRGIKFEGFGDSEMSIAQTLTLQQENPITDHEDACIVATAMTHKYDWIVTRDKKDFKKDALPKGLKVHTPRQVLNHF